MADGAENSTKGRRGKRIRAAWRPANRRLHWWAPQPQFTAADMQWIAQAVADKLPLAPDADLDALGEELRLSINASEQEAVIANTERVEPVRVRGWHDRVYQHTVALMVELGYDPAADRWDDSAERLATLRRLAERVASVDPRNAGGLPRGLHWRALLARDRVRDIEALPNALELLALVALIGREGTAPGKAGRKVSVFRQALFSGLAGLHLHMFGCAPIARDTNRERLGPSITWAKAVLCRAADAYSAASDEALRLRGIRDAHEETAAALRDAADLADATIAEALEKGWTAWLAKSAR